MDSDRIAGTAKEVKGAVKDTVGKAVGNDRLRADGMADKAEGKVQKNYGEAKDKARDVLDRA